VQITKDARPIEIIPADLCRPEHARAVAELVNAYAMDPMGNGSPLSPDVLEQLVPRLREHSTTLIFLAYDEAKPVGIAVCFLGFSTFSARPLVNIHDLAVLPEHRGRGIGRQLLNAVETKALEMGCCKVTLEVGQDNHLAKGLYRSLGFAEMMSAEAAGTAVFMTKRLQPNAAVER
jgi:ribosomal protein S18 acetylase RimI-like enzyme